MVCGDTNQGFENEFQIMNNKIKEWLEKQGYPLEMKVAKELKHAGFASTQSHFYKDLETSKHREIDVVASYTFSNNRNEINFQFVIECKNNKDKPWVAFSDKLTKPSFETYITRRPASKIGSKYLEHLKSLDEVRSKELFKVPSSFAYNVTEAFETNSDKVYTALMSVINAIKYRRERVNTETKFNNLCEIYFPVIVIGGKLFDCYLNDENENTVEEIGHKYLLWRNNILDTNAIVVEITTFESFKKRLSTFKSDLHSTITNLSDSFFLNFQSNNNYGSL